MDAINKRLIQLEEIESKLYMERRMTVQYRSQEDEQLISIRKGEDEQYLQKLTERDREEDELRQNRRLVSRASLAHSMNTAQPTVKFESVRDNDGPITRSKNKIQHSIGGIPLQSSRPHNGPPTAYDSQGRALFTRPSDGKLVYLRCYVANCDRISFMNVRALRDHLIGAKSRHKMRGLFSKNTDAIELCGEVAPGQEALHSRSDLQTSGYAPIANMAHRPVQTTPSSIDPPIRSSGDEKSLDSSSATLIDSDDNGSNITARDLGRLHRTTSTHRRSHTALRKTRAQQAEELYGGSSSSDSGDEAHDRHGKPIPINKIDQHVAANMERATGDRTLTEAEIVKRSPVPKSQDIKDERTSPVPLFSERLEQSDDCPSCVQLVATPAAVQGHDPETKPETDGGNLEDRKRHASDIPDSPFPPCKRLRSLDEPSFI